MAYPGNSDSPRSISSTLSQAKNIHRLTPKQQAIHQQTVVRHLSNRRLPGADFLNGNGNNSPNVQALSRSGTGNNGSIHHGSDQNSNEDDEWDEKTNDVASQSRSIVKDLPVFPRRDVAPKKMTRPLSAPSLSAMQQAKLESGVYLHPSQIPRSFSADFAVYQPPQEFSLLFDLPMEAFMGIGGGHKSVKSLLQSALKQVEADIINLQSADEEEEDLRIDEYGLNTSVTQSQAIPTAPDAIPPSAIERDYTIDSEDITMDDTRGSMGISHKRSSFKKKSDIPRVDSRAHAVSVKHDIEQALQQGYTRNLIIAVLQALMGPFLYGWNASVLNVPQDIVQNDETHMKAQEYNLLQTMFCLGGLVGAFVGGPLQDRIGRKKSFLIIDLVFLLSATITFLFAIGALGPIDKVEGYIWFWLGRFLVGIGCGAATAVVPTYLGEIAPPIIRGAIGTCNQLTICFGIVIVEFVSFKDFLGGKKTWPLLFLGNALPLIQLLTAWSFPESPKWLVQQGRDREAREALQRLRQTEDVRIDMMLMKGGMLHEQSAFHSPHHVSPRMRRKLSGKQVQQQKKAGMTDEPLLTRKELDQQGVVAVDGKREYEAVQINGNVDGEQQQQTKGDAVITLSNRSNRSRGSTGSKTGPFGIERNMWKAVKWATIIAIALMFMQQLSGINAVFYYSAIILAKAGLSTPVASWLGSLAISIANFLAVFIAVFSIDRAGRKLLLIISCIIMGTASVLVSISITLEDSSKFWQYSTIGFLVLFVVGFEVGLGAIPWLMMAEISPMQYRGMIVAIATASNWGANLVIAQCTNEIVDNLKFYPFAAVCGLGILFTLRFIPETNGKTAAEIQKELTNM